MQAVELINKRLIEQAVEGGATAAKIINAGDVFVAQWVRHKCQYGCPHYGKTFTCPPYAPSPQETADTLRHYQQALLVEFRGRRRDELREDPNRNLMHNLLFKLERQAFLDGFHGAIAYSAGFCRLCKECPAEKLEKPSLFNKKECLNPKMARPSLEACGVDVYSTVRKAGFELHVVREKTEPFTSFGLVLLG